MTTNKVSDTEIFLKEYAWAIRPCFMYKEEYDDCTSIKGRFHQYFIFGKDIDCTQWKRDYENCLKYDNDENNVIAGNEIIKSEKERRENRLRTHYKNDTWKKRNKPPDDWNKPLPEWLIKRNENTFLEAKAKELNNGGNNESTSQLFSSNANSFCSIM